MRIKVYKKDKHFILRPQKSSQNTAFITLSGSNKLRVWSIKIGSINCIAPEIVKTFFGIL